VETLAVIATEHLSEADRQIRIAAKRNIPIPGGSFGQTSGFAESPVLCKPRLGDERVWFLLPGLVSRPGGYSTLETEPILLSDFEKFDKFPSNRVDPVRHVPRKNDCEDFRQKFRTPRPLRRLSPTTPETANPRKTVGKRPGGQFFVAKETYSVILEEHFYSNLVGV